MERIEALRASPPLEEVHDRFERVLLSLRFELVRSEVDLYGESRQVGLGLDRSPEVA